MTPEERRIKIREQLKAGALPRTLPTARKLEPGTAAPAMADILVGQAKGPCSACGADHAYLTYKYPEREIRFDRECNAIWEAEREQP